MASSVLRRVLLTGALSLVPLAFTAAAVTESAAAASPASAAAHRAAAAATGQPTAHVVVNAHCQDAAHKTVDCAKSSCVDHAGKTVAACTAGHGSTAAHFGAGAAQSH